MTIDNPQCFESNCEYTVMVIGRSISMTQKQKFAMIITTSGIVAEPIIETNSSLSADVFFSADMEFKSQT